MTHPVSAVTHSLWIDIMELQLPPCAMWAFDMLGILLQIYVKFNCRVSSAVWTWLLAFFFLITWCLVSNYILLENSHLLYSENCARHKEHRQVIERLGSERKRKLVTWDCRLFEVDVRNLRKKWESGVEVDKRCWAEFSKINRVSLF